MDGGGAPIDCASRTETRPRHMRLISKIAPRLLRAYTTPSSAQVLVVAIGNPVPSYDGTRHSVGHLILDQMVKNYWSEFGPFRQSALNPQFHSTTALVGDHTNVTLAKSQTSYMNVSGGPVSKFWQKFQQRQALQPAMVVVHDELQVPLGKIQIRRRNTSARGHNGLRSIDQTMGNNYIKLAIGIGKPPPNMLVSDFVLSKFKPQELDILLSETMPKVAAAMAQISNGKHIFDKLAR